MPVSISGSGPITGLTSIASPTTLNGLTIPTVGFGKVLQVVSTLKQDTFTTNSTSYTDVTGLSATITPASTSSNILVLVSLSIGNSTTGYMSRGAILRGSTIIGAGTASGNRPAASFVTSGSLVASQVQSAFVLDAPATTSATTYKVQVATESGGVAQVGIANPGDNNLAQVPRLASSITLVEVGP